jgi:hypothetical protein
VLTSLSERRNGHRSRRALAVVFTLAVSFDGNKKDTSPQKKKKVSLSVLVWTIITNE